MQIILQNVALLQGGSPLNARKVLWNDLHTPFCGHFILILQLNVIIKFDRRTKGGWVPLLL